MKRCEIDDPFDRTYFVDTTGIFMRGKKLGAALEGKIKETRETKAEAIK